MIKFGNYQINEEDLPELTCMIYYNDNVCINDIDIYYTFKTLVKKGHTVNVTL